MRLAIIAIFIEDSSSVKSVNDILHNYGEIIIGRFGLPRVEENLNVITLLVKAGQEKISALTGKLGRLDNVVCQATYAKKRS